MQHTTKGAITAFFGAVSETAHRGLDYAGYAVASGPEWLSGLVHFATNATNYVAIFFFCWSALLLMSVVFAQLSRLCRTLGDGIDWLVVFLVQKIKKASALLMRKVAAGLRQGARRLDARQTASSAEHHRSSPPLRPTTVS